jgi:hypothetical protein
MTEIEGYVRNADTDMEIAGDRDYETGIRQVYAQLATANATMAAAGVLAQIRDQLGLIGELLAADPAISHVVATRQIITEMREELDNRNAEEEKEDEPDPIVVTPTGLN